MMNASLIDSRRHAGSEISDRGSARIVELSQNQLIGEREENRCHLSQVLVRHRAKNHRDRFVDKFRKISAQAARGGRIVRAVK